MARNLGSIYLIQAQANDSADKRAAAEDLFQQALNLNPVDNQAKYLLGSLYLRKGDYAHTACLMEEILASNGSFILAKYQLGQAYRALEQDDKAVNAWRDIANLPEFLLKEAKRYREEGNLSEAIELCTLLTAISPTMGEAYCNGGETLNAMGRFSEAEEWLRKGLEGTVFVTPGGSRIDCAGPLVYLLLRQGHTEDAREVAREAVILEPANATAWLLLGVSLKDADVDTARFALLRSIDLDANQLWSYLHLSDIERSQGRFAEALSWANQSARLQPNSEWAAHRQGNAYFALGSLPDAAEAFERAVQLNPDVSRFWADLADTQMAQGNVELGILEYQRAILLSPEEPYYHRKLGDAYMRMGLFDKATAEYQQALEEE